MNEGNSGNAEPASRRGDVGADRNDAAGAMLAAEVRTRRWCSLWPRWSSPRRRAEGQASGVAALLDERAHETGDQLLIAPGQRPGLLEGLAQLADGAGAS